MGTRYLCRLGSSAQIKSLGRLRAEEARGFLPQCLLIKLGTIGYLHRRT